MSIVSKLFHQIKDHGLSATDIKQAIADAIKDIRGYIGQGAINSAVKYADDHIEAFEAAVILAGQTYLRAKLGDTAFERLAEGVAVTAAHSMASALEGVLAGAAAPPAGE